jgi:guanyl-specific ribonuclease Sa
LITAQGTIEKVADDAITIRPRRVDGKFDKNLVLKLTGATRVTALSMDRRRSESAVSQKEIRREDLKPRQRIAVIYLANSPSNILMTAIVQPVLEQDLALPPDVPAKVARVLKYIDVQNTAPPGYEGGRVFLNLGRDGEQSLPRKDVHGKLLAYHEWDVNPRVRGKNRGPERLVTGSDGSAYYTADHYRTFIKIR